MDHRDHVDAAAAAASTEAGRDLGGHRGGGGRVHAGARRPARAGRADRGGRPRSRRARARTPRPWRARFPATSWRRVVADLTEAAATCRRSTAWSPPTASTSCRATGRSRSSGGWRRTCGRAGRSSSSSTTRTAAIRGSRTRSVPTSWERMAAEAGLVDTTADRARAEPVPRRDLLGGQPPAGPGVVSAFPTRPATTDASRSKSAGSL